MGWVFLWVRTIEGLVILNLVWLSNLGHKKLDIGGATLVKCQVNVQFQLLVPLAHPIPCMKS